MITYKERIGFIDRVPNLYNPALSISLNSPYRKYSHNMRITSHIMRHIIPYGVAYRSNRLNRCYTSIRSIRSHMYDKLNRWVFLWSQGDPALFIQNRTEEK